MKDQGTEVTMGIDGEYLYLVKLCVVRVVLLSVAMLSNKDFLSLVIMLYLVSFM